MQYLDVVLKVTARNSSKACAARAASSFFTFLNLWCRRFHSHGVMLIRGNGEQVLVCDNAILFLDNLAGT